MPTYEYECTDCGHRFERVQRMTDDPVKACEKCSGPVRKVLFPVGIVFKGSGFYVTDYCRPKNDAKPAESKTEAKSEPKTEAKTEAAK
jgi:putative FmdB family regulatory protein